MKMRERCPVHVLPCNLQVSVLICLILVSSLVTNTLGSYQRAKDILPGNVMPSNFSSSATPSSPPTKANFIMECWSPSGSVSDHCWLDDSTMVLVDSISRKVLKATINRTTKTCAFSYYSDAPYHPSRLACSPDGDEIYVIDFPDSVWVYDRNSLKAVWRPEGLVGPLYNVAMNRHRVVIGAAGKQPLYVYNRTRVYRGQIKISENEFGFTFTDLTEEDVFVGASLPILSKLFIYDIPQGSTVIADELDSAFGVTTVGDYILVCDHYVNHVPVFSQKGAFQSNLLFNGTDVSQPNTIAYRSETKLLSLPVDTTSHIKIFSLN